MRNWYAILTKPRQELVAEINLQRQAFDIYLPMIKQFRRRRGKWRQVVEPLFSRYLFIRLNLGSDNLSTIRFTRGVSSLVRFGDAPTAVPTDFITFLQQAADEEAGVHILNQPLFTKGDEVTVLDGPFAGLKGLFEMPTSHERVTILLEILGHAQKVNLHRDLIWPTRHPLLAGA